MTETSTPKYVMGFDPGTSTGIVIWDNTKYQCLATMIGTPADIFVNVTGLIQDFLRENIRPILVAERFDLSQATLRKSREGIDDAINVLGMLWCLSQAYDLDYHKIGRSNSKNFVKDEALKKHDLWLNSRHTRDALRVVITYLASVDQDFVRNYWVK